MNIEIKKILYATDLTENSVHAFRHCLDFAKNYNANIVVLHVIEEIRHIPDVYLSMHISEDKHGEIFDIQAKRAKEKIKNRLEELCNQGSKDQSKYKNMVESIEICAGYPSDSILQKADDFNCDIILMGTHGKGFMLQTFLGSVAKQVLRRTKKPVFIIPLPKEQ